MPNRINTINKQTCSAKHTSASDRGCNKKKRRAEKKARSAKQAERSLSVLAKATVDEPLGDASLRVLLMSAGDFALASALAMDWGTADRLVATAPTDESSSAVFEDNVEMVSAFGGHVLHGVDATALHTSEEVRRQAHKFGGSFERVVFDLLPRSSAGSVADHQAHLRQCFRSVLKGRLLAKPGPSRSAGQIHVLLTAAAGAEWGVATLATAAGLRVHSSPRPLEIEGYEPPCGVEEAVSYAFVEL
jgi:hypothetical protein